MRNSLILLFLLATALPATSVLAQRSEAEGWEIPTRQPDRITLTWAEDPATSQSVTWRTDTTVTDAVAQVAVATAAPKFTRRAETVEAETQRLDTGHVEGKDVVANYHSVTFTGLQPDTLYAYRVGDGEVWSEWVQFRTASTGQEPFSFIYFGDAQNGIFSHWSRAVRNGYSEAPRARFMIHAGDLVNNPHRDLEWEQWARAGGWIQRKVPSIPVPGNHEYGAYTEALDEKDIENLSIQWRPQFTLPDHGVEGVEDLEETVYTVDYQGVRVIALNSNRALEAQTGWLEQQLSDNPNRWTVVTFHHPVFSSSEGRDNPELRARWKPLFDEYNVDLVLQGHDHSYARGTAHNLTQGLNTRDPEAGTVYVNSVSGSKMYELKEDRWESYGADLQRGAENSQLYQVVHVSSDTLKYRAYTVTGEMYDAFDLVNGGDGPNEFISRISPDAPERHHHNTIPYEIEE
jgi:hypothetical protein